MTSAKTKAKPKRRSRSNSDLPGIVFARDFTKSPYSNDEKRIVTWLSKISRGDFGGGDDPLGFFMASYEMMIAERKELKQQITALVLDNDRLVALMKSEPAGKRDLAQDAFDIASEYAARGNDESGC